MDSKDVQGWDLYFRPHPATQERIKLIENLIGDAPRNVATSHVEEYQKMKELLPKVDMSERGELNGQTYKNNVFRLILSVPPNWSLGFFQPQSLVSFHTNDNKGEGRLQVVRLSSMTMTDENLANLYAKMAGYQFISGRNVLFSAGYGYMGQYKGASARGEQVDIRIFSTIRHGRGFILLCSAVSEKADNYVLDMAQIIQGLKFI